MSRPGTWSGGGERRRYRGEIVDKLSHVSLGVFVLTAASAPLCFAAGTTTSSISTPTRGDALAAGDRIILDSDAPIFRIKDPGDPSTTINACAPFRTEFEVAQAPTAQTTTETQAASTTTTKQSETTTVSTATAAGQRTSTTVRTTATVTIGQGRPALLAEARQGG